MIVSEELYNQILNAVMSENGARVTNIVDGSYTIDSVRVSDKYVNVPTSSGTGIPTDCPLICFATWKYVYWITPFTATGTDGNIFYALFVQRRAPFKPYKEPEEV